MKKKLSLLLCAALTATTLAGCGQAQSSPAGTDAGTEASAAGTAGSKEGEKILTYAVMEEPETLDPTLNNYSTSSTFLQNMFCGLFQLEADGSLGNAMCDTYEVSGDGLTYTFTLKDGLKWSDGSDLTAGDFEYSWKRVLNPDTASPAAWELHYLKGGEEYNTQGGSAQDVGVKAVDDKTLEVTLKAPTPYFLYLTASSNFFPVKQEVVEGQDPWTKSADTYVCNGAFTLEKINPQSSYVLKKNPNYYDAGSVKLDGVEIVIIQSPESALSAYNAGEIDAMGDNLVTSQAIDQYGDTEELKGYDKIGTRYYDFNCSKEYLSNPDVRRALAMAIDRRTICESIVPSKPEPAYGFVPYGIPYEGFSEDFRTVSGDLIQEDVEAAKKLLADAGYPNGEGLPVLTFIVTNTKENKDIAQVIQSMWKDNLGVQADIVTFESKVYWDEQKAGNFDVCFDGWTGDYLDPDTNLNCFTQARAYNQNRWSGENAMKYDSMIEECRNLADNSKRMEIFKEAEAILMDEMPIIPLYYLNAIVLAKPDVTGLVKNADGHTLFRNADKL